MIAFGKSAICRLNINFGTQKPLAHPLYTFPAPFPPSDVIFLSATEATPFLDLALIAPSWRLHMYSVHTSDDQPISGGDGGRRCPVLQ